jgi:hypothetical protein
MQATKDVYHKRRKRAMSTDDDGEIVVPDDLVICHWTDSEGEQHEDFTEEYALAALLLAEQVFLNSRWWRNEDKENISVFVNCNDIFAWGCADAEDLPHKDIENLWRMWRKDPSWGTAIWCIQKRKQMPQKPVEDLIRKAGIWDLDSMGLDPNTMDAEVQETIKAAVARGKI